MKDDEKIKGYGTIDFEIDKKSALDMYYLYWFNALIWLFIESNKRSQCKQI